MKYTSPERRVTVLVTEDSETLGHGLIIILRSDPRIEVVGWAKNGKECLRMVSELKPDIVTMDINMPLMDGIETTRAILKKHPVPILIVSSAIKDDLKKTFNALEAGAFDIIERPGAGDGEEEQRLRKALLHKVKRIASKFIHLSPAYQSHTKTCHMPEQEPSFSQGSEKVILVGASTGGPQAINFILGSLPKTIPYPLLIVQHLTEGFIHGLVNWLQLNSRLDIKVARHNETVRRGVVYFPPDNHFMGVTRSGKILLKPFCNNSIDTYSIDFLMAYTSQVFHNNCIGILLTGMGSDGANGMKLIKARGGRTIVQNEESSLIFGMPKEAIKNNAADQISPLSHIPESLLNFCTPGFPGKAL